MTTQMQDVRTTRLLATGEVRRADADAALDRKIRLSADREQRRRERRDQQRLEKRLARQDRQASRAQRGEARSARREARRTWLAGCVDYVRNNVASVYSSLIYGMAVGGAVYGQVTAALDHGWLLPFAVAGAAALEGTGLAMALTAHQLRLRGERAFAPRLLVWVCTLTAAAINYFGHGSDSAVMLAVLSLVGIVVWEIRSGAKHRKALRAAGAIPEPPTQFGWRRWARFPVTTARAWSADVRTRVSPAAAGLLAKGEADRATWREARQQARAARRAAREWSRIARTARTAARKAAKQGNAGPALGSLLRLAEGLPVVLPALPAAPAQTTEVTPDPAPTTPARTADRQVTARKRPVRSLKPARPARRAIGAGSVDVSDLIGPGRMVRTELAATGQPLTKRSLIDGLRAAGHTVSADRALVLLRELKNNTSTTEGREVA